MSKIHIYTGPMGSGKTSRMLENLHKYSNVTKQKVLLINFKKDDRAKDSISGVSTHMYGDPYSKIPLGIYVNPIRVHNLCEISEEFMINYSVIGIDEAQFYPDLDEFVRKYKDNKSITFYISGLCFDSENKPFGQLAKLLDISTTFEKMTAVCSKCDPMQMVPASFTKCIASKNCGEVIKIGGLDIYTPLCHYHFLDSDFV